MDPIAVLNIFAWPSVAVICVLILRRPIVDLLNRIKKLGTSGIETFDQQPPQQIDEKRGIDEFIRTYDNKLLVEAEQRILTDLADKKIDAPKDREKALVRSLATSHIVNHFEWTYSVIWLSQVELLRFLNGRDGGATEDEVLQFYERGMEANPGMYQNHSIERWLTFLTNVTLVNASNDRLHITVAGREFLQYLIATGKSGPFSG